MGFSAAAICVAYQASSGDTST
ncbi:uncharacterized protein G2W53_039802 [Senna tora]|uniref:Uncharacterized protein n=1 Tax=Senna tora TaxID=362788 RepID=A0A834SQJ9_9FABA|nr:uncharacterized protein G2W53_039802 [Senna tora]